MAAKPPKTDWIDFWSAVLVVQTETQCRRGEDRRSLIAALAAGEIRTRRERRLFGDSPPKEPTVETTELHPEFWFVFVQTIEEDAKLPRPDDLRSSLNRAKLPWPEPPDGYGEWFYINHDDLRSWLNPETIGLPKTGVRRGPPYTFHPTTVWTELVRIANTPDGLPDDHNDLRTQMQPWFEKTFEKAPEDTWWKNTSSRYTAAWVAN